MFQWMGEQIAAPGQPGGTRGGVFPGVQGLFVGEAEDDLEFIVAGRRGQDAGAR
ncbi:hypothetical protein P308_04695 [Pseudomonas piscis]|nr:hypothetical protein P308_04695 [Pseudomonas piscis]